MFLFKSFAIKFVQNNYLNSLQSNLYKIFRNVNLFISRLVGLMCERYRTDFAKVASFLVSHYICQAQQIILHTDVKVKEILNIVVTWRIQIKSLFSYSTSCFICLRNQQYALTNTRHSCTQFERIQSHSLKYVYILYFCMTDIRYHTILILQQSVAQYIFTWRWSFDYYTISSSLTFNVTRMQSEKENALLTALRQCWTIPRYQTTSGHIILICSFV